ncbi:MAG TPA: DNA primase [Armatimonadota bacterium]|jgi:DNA primase
MDAKEEIRKRVDIVDYISTYVRLAKRGKNFLGLCPFHAEKTPSFNVSREQQWYKCFGCGEGGDIFKFVMKMDGLTFREALERLAERTGVQMEERRASGPTADLKERARAMHAEAARFYAELLWKTPAALDYAHNRGLTDETLARFGIGWAPDGWEALTKHLGAIGWSGADLAQAGLAKASERGTFYDAFRSRLMFPIFDVQSRVVAFGGRMVGDGEPKYLNSSESPIFFKSGTLYALNFANKAITQENRVLVMEGFMDVVATHQAGFPIAVATLGTSLTENHVALLARKTKNVILAYDADSAGVKAALRGAPMFEDAEMDVRLLMLPGGHDPDSYLKAEGPQEFAARLNEAVQLTDFNLAQLQLQFNLEDPNSLTEYVKAALPVLALVKSNVSRDRYIRRLAEVWARGDMARVAYREEDIRRDLAAHHRRMLSEARAKWRSTRGDAPSPSLADLHRPKVEAPRPEPVSGVGLAEKEVLRAMLQEPELVLYLQLTDEEFSEGPHREIAAIALKRLAGSGDADARLDVAALPEALANLVTDLSLREDQPLTAEHVQGAVERMRMHARQRRLSELKPIIQQRLQAGDLQKDDPLWLEWQSLQRQGRVSDRSRIDQPPAH